MRYWVKIEKNSIAVFKKLDSSQGNTNLNGYEEYKNTYEGEISHINDLINSSGMNSPVFGFKLYDDGIEVITAENPEILQQQNCEYSSFIEMQDKGYSNADVYKSCSSCAKVTYGLDHAKNIPME